MAHVGLLQGWTLVFPLPKQGYGIAGCIFTLPHIFQEETKEGWVRKGKEKEEEGKEEEDEEDEQEEDEEEEGGKEEQEKEEGEEGKKEEKGEHRSALILLQAFLWICSSPLCLDLDFLFLLAFSVFSRFSALAPLAIRKL